MQHQYEPASVSLWRRLIISVAVTLLAMGARAETYYVATNGSDGASGTGDWGNALQTIEAALAKATSAGDVVWLSNGVYALAGPEILVARGIVLRGYSANAAETVLDGGAPARVGRCLNINHADALVCGLTVCNATTNNTGGGGVLVGSSGGTISNCVVMSNQFTGNNANHGGGGIASSAAGWIRNCTIEANTTTQRGGGGGRGGRYWDCLINGNSGSVNASHGGGLQAPSLVSGCTIAGNSVTGRGGGIAFEAGSANCLVTNSVICGNYASQTGGGVSFINNTVESLTEIVQCLISGNSSVSTTLGGGGIGASPGSNALVVLDCTLAANTASRGGAVYWNTASTDSRTRLSLDRCRVLSNSSTYASGGGGGLCIRATQAGSQVDVRNCLLDGNSAVATGGCAQIVNYGGLLNCTVVTNRANGSSGGLYLGANAWVTNTLVYYNSAPADPDWSAEAGAVIAYGCVPTSSPDICTETITGEPAFADLDGGDYRLSVNSPCVNRGSTLAWMSGATDLGGGPRVDGFGKRVDIGAYELLPAGTLFGIR